MLGFQAAGFVSNSIKRAATEQLIPGKQRTGYVMTFRYSYSGENSIKIFQETDAEWIHFVASNRQDELLNFAGSEVYNMLFDFSTGLWREGPDYLRGLYLENNSTAKQMPPAITTPA